jgi:predicted XRE-type DNA-binding protein
MAREQETDAPRVIRSSGNVFADLGIPEPDEELAKADLASCIMQVIRRRRLTQVAAAARMGIDQPKVSALVNGRLANFSSDRLMHLLTALDQDVVITVKDKPRSRARARIRVQQAKRAPRAARAAKKAKPQPARVRRAARTTEKSRQLRAARATKKSRQSRTLRATRAAKKSRQSRTLRATRAAKKSKQQHAQSRRLISLLTS